MFLQLLHHCCSLHLFLYIIRVADKISAILHCFAALTSQDEMNTPCKNAVLMPAGDEVDVTTETDMTVL